MSAVATPANVKEAVLEMVGKMPNDATIDDIMEELYVRQKIEIGLRQLDAGQSVTHEEAKARLAKWLT